MDSRRSRFPGYDVLAKRQSPSWNEQTREVIEPRLAISPDEHSFFTDAEWRTLRAVCDRIVPQPGDRPPIPVATLVDRKMAGNAGDGFRLATLPSMQEAWRLALAAIDEEARLRFGAAFHELTAGRQDTLLGLVQHGDARSPLWAKVPPRQFFKARLLRDVVESYYAHPTSWNEIGFGGPASPRGYVRMGFDRRDPWEAEESRDV
jgi:hypothetical protein